MQNQLSAYVTSDGKGYSIHFPADRLDSVKKKYAAKGATLKVGTAQTLAPAAQSLAKPTLKRNELPPVRKALKTARPIPDEKSALAKKPKPYQRVAVKKPNAKIRPVICLTTGTYYPSMKDAAEACGGHVSAISNQISGIRHRKAHRGMVHRYATSAEIEQKRMLA